MLLRKELAVFISACKLPLHFRRNAFFFPFSINRHFKTFCLDPSLNEGIGLLVDFPFIYLILLTDAYVYRRHSN